MREERESIASPESLTVDARTGPEGAGGGSRAQHLCGPFPSHPDFRQALRRVGGHMLMSVLQYYPDVTLQAATTGASSPLPWLLGSL